MMKLNGKIPLFWYSLNVSQYNQKIFSKGTLIKILGLQKENYGDLLSKYLVEKISNRKTLWYNKKAFSKNRHYFVIGSILNNCNDKSIVWGSGIINKSHWIDHADFRAVRGPLTRKRILELGYNCPEIYGDPALLLPKYYKPKIQKNYKLGIIPHFYDYCIATSFYKDEPEVKIVNLLTNNIEKTTDDILSCKLVVSSSLHGIIVAHAYGIPAIWIKFSNNLYGDDIKFEDYLLSVDLVPYEALLLTKPLAVDEIISHLESLNNLPSKTKINCLNNNLIKACPFT